MALFRFLPLAAAAFLLAGCGKAPSESTASGPDSTEQTEELSPAEKAAVSAAQPFLNAIVNGDYPAAYALLSPYAKASMSPGQFVPPPEKNSAAHETKALTNPSLQDFQGFMAAAVNHYGKPAKILSSNVMSTDPNELAGKGAAIETAFIIGLMPSSTPVEIRRASVRSQIGVILPPDQLKKIAEERGMTVEELQKDEDSSFYFNLKVVLIEEGGALKVGYFEFTPPSMLD
jgi:hypothetical protein